MMPAGVAEMGWMRSITFPVAGPISYGNDFGACRDGCRRQHKGNDLIGDRLQPLLAMRDGVVDRLLDHPTAGYGIVVQDADGWEYHIYHVNNDMPGGDDGGDDGTWRFAPGIEPGSPVTAGQVIAWMGDSGNSEGSVPHAHVEIRTPDGTAINPFWSLVRAQRDANCAVTEVADGTPTAAADAADLPGDWTPLAITGGRPGSGDGGSTNVDPPVRVHADRRRRRCAVGDPRHDEDCANRSAPSDDPRRARSDPRHRQADGVGRRLHGPGAGVDGVGCLPVHRLDMERLRRLPTRRRRRHRPCRTPRPSSSPRRSSSATTAT